MGQYSDGIRQFLKIPPSPTKEKVPKNKKQEGQKESRRILKNIDLWPGSSYYYI